MKSHTENHSERQNYTRLVLDVAELCSAMKRQRLTNFIKDVLRPQYGDLQAALLDLLVDDCERSVLALVASRIEQSSTEENCIGVAINDASIKKVRNVEGTTNYWVGELSVTED